MLQLRATSSLRRSCLRQWQSIRCLSESDAGSSSAANAGTTSQSDSSDKLLSLDAIFARASTPKTQAAESSVKKLSAQNSQSSPRLPSLILTRSSDRTKRPQGLKEGPAVGQTTSGKSSPSGLSLLSRKSSGTMRSFEKNGKTAKSYAKNGTASKPRRGLTSVQAETVDLDEWSEELTAEEDLVEEDFDEERTEELRTPFTMPVTDLTELFAASRAVTPMQSRAAARLQFTREMGGDYTSYLPTGSKPKLLPAEYAHLALGRNRRVSVKSQARALDIIKQGIAGQVTKPGEQNLRVISHA
ncbi:hypothetical protein HYDPIDRAFT_26609 [Hydnomerulius pinastri MD-312]|nr:hypothetical protein HYDPIDRAFT_26609 [Hydnomerulius pinastri MD-312]